MSLFPTEILQEDEKLVIAWLCSQIRLNPARLEQILKVYESCSLAVEDDFIELKKLKVKWLQKWQMPTDLSQDLEKFASLMQNEKIVFVTCLDDNYPIKLKILEDYPVVLYMQGNSDLLYQNQTLTVVGSRSFTHYGQVLVEKILQPVCALGLGVISGLALGIDTLAHQIAVENNAPTIAVLGSGLNEKSFYPVQNLLLRQQILAKNGLIISEYPVGTMPSIYTFPQRNRLLAAMSELTWVVQAGEKSGSLITALRARDLGKTVATTPGDIRDGGLLGNLKLLKEGANIISEAEDILQLLGLKSHPEIQVHKTIQFGSYLEEKIYKNLGLEPQNIEEISYCLDLNTVEVSTGLSLLEINGLVKNIGENRWVRG